MDNKFWKYCAIVVVALIVSVTASCQATKISMVKMVEGGATPQEAACALNHYNTTNEVMCMRVAELGSGK